MSKKNATQAEFPGFTEEIIERVDADQNVQRLKILLPATAEMEQLLCQRAAAVQEAWAKHAEESALKIKVQDAAEKKPFEPALTSRQDKEKREAAQARTDMEQAYEATRATLQANEGSARHQVQVYAWDAPLKLVEDRKSTPDRELHDRDKALFLQLKKLGAYRGVCAWERLDIVLDGLKYLRASQPHFSRVVDLIEGRVRLAQELDEPMRIPPVLLAGPPGVGKTHFTLELARVIERPVRRHSFDAAHTSSALMGSDRNWANTRYGLIFEAVCMGDRADPIVLLDEIDKAAEHRHGGSPLAPLYSLLEPVTSATVTDISAGLQFDASHVFFVATANDLRFVPRPIQSRFQVFYIGLPTPEQSIDLAQAVAAAHHLKFSGFEAPTKRLVTLLAHLTPREQIQALEQAYAHAVVNGRKHLLRQDLPADVLQDDGEDPAAGRFLH